MAHDLFERIPIPLGSPEDAATTAEATVPCVEARPTVVAVHVVEKAMGASDKASVGQRAQFAEEVSSAVRDQLADVEVELDAHPLHARGIARTVIDLANGKQASAIVLAPRGPSRWVKLLTGDVSHKLVERTDTPVSVVPEPVKDGR